MTLEIDPEQLRIFGIFHPYAVEKTLKAYTDNIRFVHYTSAQAAMSIIKSNEVWLRKASSMNDFTEVQHGIDCLVGAYKSDAGTKFREAINRVNPNVQKKVEELFDGYVPSFRFNTYLTCMSEHKDEEDNFGRLSMWRAYGANNGVALVLNNRAFLAPSDAIKAYTSPVAYMNDQGFSRELVRIAQNIEKEVAFLRGLDERDLVNYLFNLFQASALCAKHPGFQEEAEWRVVYSPDLNPSGRLMLAVEQIGGVPQQIYKLPLKNFPDEGFLGAEIPELLDRIIIGPSEFRWDIRAAFISLLKDAGVADPVDKVFVSEIPLRT